MRGSKSYAQILSEPFNPIIASEETSRDSGENISALVNGIIGELRGINSMTEVQDNLKESGFECKIRPLGGLSVLFSFNVEINLQSLLLEYGEIFAKSCTCFYICPIDYACKWKLGWVEMQGVPLKVWGKRFFTDVGNFLGRLVLIDEATEDQSKLEVARVLISYEVLSKLPSTLMVTLPGKEHRVPIRFTETTLSKLTTVSSKISKMKMAGEENSGRQKRTEDERWKDSIKGGIKRGVSNGTMLETNSNEESSKSLSVHILKNLDTGALDMLTGKKGTCGNKEGGGSWAWSTV